MSDVYVAIEPCGCVAGVTTLRRPDAVLDFLKEMKATGIEVIAEPVEVFRARPPVCPVHPNGPGHWPANQEAAS